MAPETDTYCAPSTEEVPASVAAAKVPCFAPVGNHSGSDDNSLAEPSYIDNTHLENAFPFSAGGAMQADAPAPVDFTAGSAIVPATTFDVYKLLDPVKNQLDTNTLFSSAEEANSSTLPAATPGWDDPTLPSTDEQKRAIVKALCLAMTSTEVAEDNPTTIKQFVASEYDAARIEALAWNILDATVARVVYGPLQLAQAATKKRKKSSQTDEMASFADRMGVAIEGLAVSCIPSPIFNLHTTNWYVCRPIRASASISWTRSTCCGSSKIRQGPGGL